MILVISLQVIVVEPTVQQSWVIQILSACISSALPWVLLYFTGKRVGKMAPEWKVCDYTTWEAIVLKDVRVPVETIFSKVASATVREDRSHYSSQKWIKNRLSWLKGYKATNGLFPSVGCCQLQKSLSWQGQQVTYSSYCSGNNLSKYIIFNEQKDRMTVPSSVSQSPIIWGSSNMEWAVFLLIYYLHKFFALVGNIWRQ